MKVGFIGLGNAGGKLAGSLQRNGYEMVVRDLDRSVAQPFIERGAGWAETNRQLAEDVPGSDKLDSRGEAGQGSSLNDEEGAGGSIPYYGDPEDE